MVGSCVDSRAFPFPLAQSGKSNESLVVFVDVKQYLDLTFIVVPPAKKMYVFFVFRHKIKLVLHGLFASHFF